MDFATITSFASKHPIETGVGVVAVGVGALWLLGAFGGSSSGSAADSGAAAFYAAQAGEAASGNALQAHQIDATAAVAIAGLQANADTSNATTWANSDLAITQSNNAAATAGFPYAVEAEAISTFGQVASLPPITTTTSKSGNSLGGLLFGGLFGGGKKTTTTQTPNPSATIASSYLATLANNLYVQH